MSRTNGGIRQRGANLHWRKRGLFMLVSLLALALLLLAGCGNPTVATPANASGVAGPLLGNPAQALTQSSAITATPTNTPPTSHGANPPAPAISATAAMLINPDTGQIYLAQNADQERAMASTTKIMTAVVAMTTTSLDHVITVGSDATALDNGIASVAGLQFGDKLTLHELLYALLLPSGDDAAVVIADGVAGSQPAFIALMNTEAQLLGLRHTHYTDVHGLDAPNHYTTARDLLTLTQFALRFPAFAQIVSTATWQLPASSTHAAYSWANTNLLLSGFADQYAGATGVKTGFTGNAGACLVFAATRNGHHLLGVVLNEPDETLRFTDAAALLDWGFGIEQRQT